MNEQVLKTKTFYLEPVKEFWREGYIFPVRNRLNNLLENEFLPDDLKDRFLAEWGERIIYIDEYHDWYQKIRQSEA